GERGPPVSRATAWINRIDRKIPSSSSVPEAGRERTHLTARETDRPTKRASQSSRAAMRSAGSIYGAIRGVATERTKRMEKERALKQDSQRVFSRCRGRDTPPAAGRSPEPAPIPAPRGSSIGSRPAPRPAVPFYIPISSCYAFRKRTKKSLLSYAGPALEELG